MKHNPIKRHTSLVWLSREHHHELLFCWKIRQGLDRGVDLKRIRDYISYFWHAHLQHHIDEEEAKVFIHSKSDYCRDAFMQHMSIRNIIAMILAGPTTEVKLVESLADKLEEHTRFEERVVFPYLEKKLGDKSLAIIGEALQLSHHTPFQEQFADEFWRRSRQP